MNTQPIILKSRFARFKGLSDTNAARILRIEDAIYVSGEFPHEDEVRRICRVRGERWLNTRKKIIRFFTIQPDLTWRSDSALARRERALSNPVNSGKAGYQPSLFHGNGHAQICQKSNENKNKAFLYVLKNKPKTIKPTTGTVDSVDNIDDSKWIASEAFIKNAIERKGLSSEGAWTLAKLVHALMTGTSKTTGEREHKARKLASSLYPQVLKAEKRAKHKRRFLEGRRAALQCEVGYFNSSAGNISPCSFDYSHDRTQAAAMGFRTCNG